MNKQSVVWFPVDQIGSFLQYLDSSLNNEVDGNKIELEHLGSDPEKSKTKAIIKYRLGKVFPDRFEMFCKDKQWEIQSHNT